jgi:hypothetical protein
MVDEVARTEEFYEIPTSCKTPKVHCRVKMNLTLGPILNQ